MDIPPPSPTHILRSHTTPLTTLSISNDNERIYSADSSGLVVVTSTRSLRALASWRAHDDGVLGVQEWGRRVITHGRDNKLHIWTRIDTDDHASHIGGSASVPGLPTPTLCYSMDVNALNYCRFSLMLMPANDDTALICIPNLVESSLADIWSLPDCQRIHAAIGKSDTLSSDDGRTASSTSTGIIMSMHLFTSPQSYTQSHPQTHTSTQNDNELRLLCAYENGGVILRRYNPTTPNKTTSVEGIGWDVIWSVKVHVESIMAMSVSKDNKFALTVSADHLIGRYDLTTTSPSPPSNTPHSHSYRTKHPGNGSIAIRDDGRVCAVGGWDGRIRLYSTRTMKPLGTLRYHKSGCQGVVFARSLTLPLSLSSTSTRPSTFDAPAREDEEGTDEYEHGDEHQETSKHQHQEEEEDNEEDDEELSNEEKAERSRWLVSAGKDGRVAVWVLKDFESLPK